MPRKNPRQFCKVCGKNVSEVGPLSTRGLCVADALARNAANTVQISEHRGPFFDHWRRQTLAAFGVTLPEE